MTEGPGLPEEEPGELVETGTFRVDRERMLQVLSDWQAPSPEKFLDSWLRCAAASGATKVKIARLPPGAGFGFDFTFNGSPFTRQELADIYSPLLDGARGRGAYFAAGVLALLRTKPRCVQVSSPEASLTITGLLEQTPGPAQGAAQNILRVVWEQSPGAPLLAADLERHYGLSLYRAAVSTARGPSETWADGVRRYKPQQLFEEGGRRGAIVPLPPEANTLTGYQPGQSSSLELFLQGVALDTCLEKLPLAPVAVSVNDDSLQADASLTRCVKDERYDELKAFVKKKTEDLTLAEIELQQKALAAVGERLHIPLFAGLWRARMKSEAAWQAVTSDWRYTYLPEILRNLFRPAVPIPPEGYAFAETGDRQFWLREACLRVHISGVACSKALRQALWQAPLLLSNHGTPLSLAAVHGMFCQFEKVERLPVSAKTAAEGSGWAKAVWLASPRDERFLAHWVPEEMWEKV